MVTINKVYTKNGDLGQTYLANGQMIEKSSARIELLALLDSLMLEVGYANFLISTEAKIEQKVSSHLLMLLNRLFDQGAVIALTSKSEELLPTELEINIIENWIDQLNQELPPLKNFLLPQGNALLSQLHRCRVQSRILEQKLWSFNIKEPLELVFLKFFNRISDYFFVAARYIGQELSLPEVIWQTGQRLN